MAMGNSTRGTTTKISNNSSTVLTKLHQDDQLSLVENVMHAVENVATLIQSGCLDKVSDNLINVFQHLKVYGACLEVLYKDRLDRALDVFKNYSRNESNIEAVRLCFLELVELRANKWRNTNFMGKYYNTKLMNNEITTDNPVHMPELSANLIMETVNPPQFQQAQAVILAPGELMKSSGKFAKPTRIVGKNYCKDEVIIRNADSGKVMGIKGRRVHMIEELSETIISFQRVNPGAKERLVQITGANEASINHAKTLIEDTIKRNASPVSTPLGTPVTSSMSQNSISSFSQYDERSEQQLQEGVVTGAIDYTISGVNNATEFKQTLNLGKNSLKIVGENFELVYLSTVVLENFFKKGYNLSDLDFLYDELKNGNKRGILLNEKIDDGNIEEVTVDKKLVHDITPSDASNLQLPSPTVDTATPLTLEFRSAASRVTSPTEGLISPVFAENENNNNYEYIKLRRSNPAPHLPYDGRLQYSKSMLAKMGLSPLCVNAPENFNDIRKRFPDIIKQEAERFDAESYLFNKTQHNLCISASDESLLSNSST